MPLLGVIFDMDGTLTVPVIDFAEMRRRIGVPAGDILKTVRAWPAERPAAAFDVIEEIEERARVALTLQPGARELMAFLDARGLRKAIVTRNTRRTVNHLLLHLATRFDPVVTRDFEPVKPDPAPALHICRAWGIAPVDALMVGDYRDDILCGAAAGMATCLLRNERNGEFASLARHVADDLDGVRSLVAGLLG